VKKTGMIWSAFEDLTLAKLFLEMHLTILMGLQSESAQLCGSFLDVIAMLEELAVCRVYLGIFGADDEGLNGCWKLAPQPYVDKRGRFTLNKYMDCSVEIVDVLPDMELMFAGKWPDC